MNISLYNFSYSFIHLSFFSAIFNVASNFFFVIENFLPSKVCHMCSPLVFA